MIARPEPTTDVRSACADLDRAGYCILTDVLPPGETEALRARVLEQAAAERALALDHEYPAEADGDDVNQWVYALVNKGAGLRTLPVHPVAHALATHVLGASYLLSSMDAHITYPGNLEMPLHADQWWMPPPVVPGQPLVRQGDLTRASVATGAPEPSQTPIIGPLILNVMWMLTDFSPDNGATRLVPGSHLSGVSPDPAVPHPAHQVDAPAGSIVAWDGRTWHASGLNTSTGPRVGLTTYFCGPMIRQLTNGVHALRSEVRAELDDEYLALLGFRPWASYGMTDDPSCAVAAPGDETAGELA